MANLDVCQMRDGPSQRKVRPKNVPITAPLNSLGQLVRGDQQEIMKRAIIALRRWPVHFHRDNVIVCEGDPADYMFLVVSGTVRACRTFETGSRCIVAFYLPGDLFGWTNDARQILSVEAATDAMVLFLKQSTLQSIASRERRVARHLQAATIEELRRMQEHALLVSRSAKGRVATFLSDLWARMGKGEHVDLPMSHQDIADYLGMTIETLSRAITQLEQCGLITRVSPRKLILRQPRLLVDLRD